MGNLIDMLRNDEEAESLRKKYHEITGEWLGFHWDCFGSIEEYKEHMKKVIKEHNTTSR